MSFKMTQKRVLSSASCWIINRERLCFEPITREIEYCNKIWSTFLFQINSKDDPHPFHLFSIKSKMQRWLVWGKLSIDNSISSEGLEVQKQLQNFHFDNQVKFKVYRNAKQMFFLYMHSH
jgi:hypothetical protein